MTDSQIVGLPLEPLPCPFCGAFPEVRERSSDVTDTKWWHSISCFCGGYSTCAYKGGRTYTDALAAWNTRTK